MTNEQMVVATLLLALGVGMVLWFIQAQRSYSAMAQEIADSWKQIGVAYNNASPELKKAIYLNVLKHERKRRGL